MDVSLYFQPFLVSFSVVVVLLLLLREMLTYATRSALCRTLPVRRFGGGAVIIAFLFAIFLNPQLIVTPVIAGMIVGSGAILLFGIWDDVVTFGWKAQLMFQLFLGVLLFVSGMRIFSLPMPFVGQVFVNTLPGGVMIGCIVLILWIVFVMNVLNWVDGIDGLLPSIATLAFLALLFLSISPQVNQPPLGILSVALTGAVLGLLLFNMPPSRFFAGTSGSFFIGFSLASLSVLSGAKIATAILVLSLPILDALWVFTERLQLGLSPFHGGDSRHLHYRLREIGWSDRHIVAGYTIYTGIVGVIALSTGSLGKTVALLFLGIIITVFLFWVRKRALSMCHV